jgi:chromosome segregation ATPase
METLSVLEKKIASLVTLIKDLKTQNNQLQVEKDTLSLECDVLKEQHTKLAQANAHLIEQLDAIESSLLQGTKDVEDLSLEKSLTKAVVDDLIKSIDALVENEQQS